MRILCWLLILALWVYEAETMHAAESETPLHRAPRLVSVPADRLAQAEMLGTPEVRTLLGYTRRVLHLHDGHTLAVFSFGSAEHANRMFLIDSRNLKVQSLDIPHNDFASHGAALGKDGNIYIMPYGAGHAYHYDVHAGQFAPIETGLPAGEYTWDAFGASNGRIYFGTYPNAYLGEYDPATGKCALWKQVVPNTKYVVDFQEDNAGRILCRAWGPDNVWLAFDPQTRRVERTEAPTSTAPMSSAAPALPEGDTGLTGPVVVAGRRFVLSFPSSRLWEIGPEGKMTLCGESRSPAEPWYLEATPGAVVGISHFGAVFRYDVAHGQMQRRQLPNRVPGGNSIMFLEAITPRCVLGGNYSQQNLFQIDPETSKIKASEQMTARVTGEAMCAVGLQGRAYLGIYVDSLLAVYDPKHPFAYGKNPQELIALGARYAQTRPGDATTDGKSVFICSESAYGHLGGALAVIDPKTRHVDVYPHLLPDQDLSSLAYDPQTGLIWGGTNRWGQMRSHPPTQPSAVLYAFDPTTRQLAATLTPWPGADVVSVLGVSGNGVLVATNGQEVALIDTRQRAILYQGALPIGVPGKVRRGSDGAGYTLAGGTLYRWDFTQNTLTPVATTPGCVYLTEVSPNVWAVANTASVYCVRLSQEVSQKP